MRERLSPEERRKQLLEVAFECFSEQGYVATTVTDLVKRAGVAKGTFFYYFPTKEDALVALMEEECIVIIDRVKPQQVGLGAIDRMKQLLALIDEPNRLEPIFTKLCECGEVRIMQRLWKVLQNAFSPVLMECIELGIAEGVMHCQNIEVTITYFWSIIDCLYICKEDEQLMRVYDEGKRMGYGLIEYALGMESGVLL